MAENGGGGQYYEAKVIAQLFGVSVRRVQQLTQEGVIETVKIPGEGRRYELVPTIQKYVKYLSDKAYNKSRSEKEMELREQKLQAEVALKESQGELHRLRTAIASGRYIEIEEARLDYERFFLTFKKFAMSMPGRLVGMISGCVEPLEARRIEKGIQGEIQTLLKGFVVAATDRPPVTEKLTPADAAGKPERNDGEA